MNIYLNIAKVRSCSERLIILINATTIRNLFWMLGLICQPRPFFSFKILSANDDVSRVIFGPEIT